ncbi:MAG: ABC transporter ATP-binding protein [Actinomycetota bacterium]
MEPLLTEIRTGSSEEFPALDVVDVYRRFRDVEALRGVTLEVWPGEVHALLGPNGAGKTTLLRILVGLLIPDAGDVGVLGQPLDAMTSRRFRRSFGFVPSGDRSFYLRVSGAENLLFFARLHGLPKRQAATRARELLAMVGLEEAADRRVGLYSHGMQKRLSVARALLTEPRILFVDEATHDLDPLGAEQIRELVREQARDGVAVVWTTQRVEEIRGFADHVTLLQGGTVRFQGTVPQLLASVPRRRFLVRVRPEADQTAMQAALDGMAELGEGSDPEHFILGMAEGETLGRAIAALEASGISILACSEEGSGVEEAFLFLTQEAES